MSKNVSASSFAIVICFMLVYPVFSITPEKNDTYVISSNSQLRTSSSILGRSIGYMFGSQLQDDDDNITECDNLDNVTGDICDFIQSDSTDCGDVAVLVDYLSFRFCTMGGSPVLAIVAYIVMIIWFILLVSLLATTADVYFIPSLNFLSEKLRLSPAVAGITLLAVGNGAPDVFTAIAGVQGDDFPLVLGALIGASICISSFVMGSVVMVNPRGGKNPANVVRKRDFLRDILVYILATIIIISICQDEKIYIYESAMLLLLYIVYVAIVVVWSRKERDQGFVDPSVNSQLSNSSAYSRKRRLQKASEKAGNVCQSYPPAQDGNYANEKLLEQEDRAPPDFLEGLEWPAGSILIKIQHIMEFPFSVLRWLTTPSTDNQWGPRRRIFSCLSPLPLMYLVLLDGFGWDGFNITVGPHNFPLVAILAIIGIVITVIFFLTTNKVRPPMAFEIIFAIMAFSSAVLWLDIEANEVVALLQTWGIELDISSTILGLTVLAMGNSVGDFVADTTVAKRGLPAMAVASCLGSPLLNDIVGLGISLTVATLKLFPEPFEFKLDSQVILAWGFLGVTLVSSLFTFPITNFAPPRQYGIYLILLYIVFITASVIVEKMF